MDLDLFSHISSRAKDPITSKELVAATKGDEYLICEQMILYTIHCRPGIDLTETARTLRLLASVDFVQQTGPDQWCANATTHAMTSAPLAAGHRFVYVILHSRMT